MTASDDQTLTAAEKEAIQEVSLGFTNLTERPDMGRYMNLKIQIWPDSQI